MTTSDRPYSVALIGPDEPDGLANVPQLYRTAGLDAAGRHALFARVVEQCSKRWGTADVIVQSQTVDLRAGVYPGIPVAQAVPETAVGEVAVACLGAPLLELDGARRTADELVFAASGSRWRFGAADDERAVVVLLVTPDDGRPLATRRRHCARVFAPPPPVAAPPLPAWAIPRNLHFESRFDVYGDLPQWDQDTVAAEPLFRAASTMELERNGGPIARAFVDALPSEWRGPDADVIVQVKRDELSPGWWPALIGWHMDGTSRANRRGDGRPDLRDPGRKVEQLLQCVGPPSPTGVLVGDVWLPEVPLGLPQEEVPGVWQRILLDEIEDVRIARATVPHGRLCGFGWGGFHTATQAKVPGWRLFVKAMRGRGDEPRNERPQRATVTWSLATGHYPSDPCGVFPEV